MKIKNNCSGVERPVCPVIRCFRSRLSNADQAQSREAIGTVSVSAPARLNGHAHEMLNKKAEEQGASSYRIIEARSGDHWHATAELYK